MGNIFVEGLMLKIFSKVKKSYFYWKYRKNIINNQGDIVFGKEDFFMIHPYAKIQLGGVLTLNANSMGNNGRNSLLRLDKDSELIIEGKFGFMYGADIILFPGAKLKLGKGSFINSDCKIRCHKEISIGEGCAISHDFTIMDSDAHVIEEQEKTKPVSIGNHVWIGTRVTVLKGVTIGNDVVVAAGTVVNRDVPDGCLVAGVPCKIVKRNIKWRMK